MEPNDIGTRSRTDRAVEPPRRILLYSGSYNHITDGVTLTLNRLVSHLERRGSEVMVVAPTTRDPELIPNGIFHAAPSIPIPGRGEYRMATILPPHLRSRISRFSPDVIHVATPDLIGRWTMSYARRNHIPVVTTYHTDFLSYLQYYGLGCLEPYLLTYLRYFYNRCDLVCVPTQSMMNALQRRGIDGRMRIWGRGVDTSRFHPENRSLKWRREHGIGDGVAAILFTGRVVREKNVDLIPLISRHLRDLNIPHRMVIVGDGPALDDLKRAMPEGVFTGRLEGKELSRAYASSEIFLFPSTTETFGNVILEGMASGLPVVCADATGSRDLVGDNVNGFVTSAGDAEEMGGRLGQLILQSELRTSMKEAALRHAASQSWERTLEEMVVNYHDVKRLQTAVGEIPRRFGVIVAGLRRGV